MEKEKVLEIEFQPVWDKWAWRITKQDKEVFPRDDFYDDTLGVYCNGNPEFIKGRNDLFILSDESDTKIGINICDEEQKKMIELKKSESITVLTAPLILIQNMKILRMRMRKDTLSETTLKRNRKHKNMQNI